MRCRIKITYRTPRGTRKVWNNKWMEYEEKKLLTTSPLSQADNQNYERKSSTLIAFIDWVFLYGNRRGFYCSWWIPPKEALFINFRLHQKILSGFIILFVSPPLFGIFLWPMFLFYRRRWLPGNFVFFDVPRSIFLFLYN